MDQNIYLFFSIIVLIFTICTTSTYAFNITYFLDQHSEFSTFNSLLTRTGVAAKVNKQGTVTVLVVDNAAVGSLEGQPQSAIENIVATHVLLDYYDKNKLDNLEGKSAKGTNLFQKSGKTSGEQGLLSISNSGGQVTFASAVKGAPHDSKMVKVVSSKPFDISVIQVSKPIMTPGLGQPGPTSSPSSSPKAAPVAAPTLKKAKESAPAPAPGPASAPSPATTDEEAADGPVTDTEGPAPTSGPAPGPATPEDEADDEEPVKMVPPKNGGGRLNIGGGAVVAVFTGLLALL